MSRKKPRKIHFGEEIWQYAISPTYQDVRITILDPNKKPFILYKSYYKNDWPDYTRRKIRPGVIKRFIQMYLKK